MRSKYLLIWLHVVALLTVPQLGCDSTSITTTRDAGRGAGNSDVYSASNVPPQSSSIVGLPPFQDDKILIASFNIQAFGQSKGNDPWVMQHLAEIIRQFDLVAVQEIRSLDQRLLPNLLAYINHTGRKYDYVLSGRLGRTSSKEQYAYIYDTERLYTSPDEAYLINDQPQDLLHREPFVARFVCRVAAGKDPFRFVLINMHTDPDEVRDELNVLDDVFKNVRTQEYPEDDIILLGDLNVERHQFQELGQIPGLDTVLTGIKSNSRQTRLIDHILIDRSNTSEYTGRSGVLDLAAFFQLQLSDAEKLSDHYPVWAEFSMTESNSQQAILARQPSDTTR